MKFKTVLTDLRYSLARTLLALAAAVIGGLLWIPTEVDEYVRLAESPE